MPPAAASVAKRRMINAEASLSRLPPSRITLSRRGSGLERRIVVAAAASGGATMAPSAIAAAQGRPGASQRAISPTANVVESTAPTTRPATGAQIPQRGVEGGVEQDWGHEQSERKVGRHGESGNAGHQR